MEPSTKKNEVHDLDDRLSNLPDAILHHILTLSDFQIFDVVKLGVLSKRWNRLWITMPYLDIDIEDVPRDPTFCLNLISFINWVLVRQAQSGLVRFRLGPNVIICEFQILRWLRVVVERNVQEIDIIFLPSREFRLPLFIAVNDSLKDLRITLECLHAYDNIMQVPSVVRLNQLRCLVLYDVAFSDSNMLQRLFSGCCSLESLILECELRGFGFLDFSSTHLKELTVVLITTRTYDVSNFEIKVSCPNLISFNYSGPVAKNYILEDLSSLKTAEIYFCELTYEVEQVGHTVHSILKEVHNVSKLYCDMNVIPSLSYVIDEMIRCPISFPKVKFLRMYIATVNDQTRAMFHLLDHCPNLEVLTLVSDQWEDEWEDEYWELQCEGIVSWKSNSHLKTIKFVDFTGSGHELDFLRFLFKNAKGLERMDITWDSHSSISVEVIDEVLVFPKASSGVMVTFIDP